MGVSLERVQFKFASIIGELCSDPDVLSQFAVWLDLRLAEYKLKGAISLECSGEEPDPVWLKGLNKGRRLKSSGQITHSEFGRHDQRRPSGDSSFRGTYGTCDPVSASHSPDALGFHLRAVSRHHRQSESPDIVVVKEESSDVFPVSLHSHVNANSDVSEGAGGSGHKRSPFSGSSDHWSQGSHGQNLKRRRTTAADIESPSNQSLMSVLGVTDSSETVASAVSNSSVAPSASCDVNVTSPIASTSAVSPQADMSADFTNTSFSDSQSFQDMSWLNNSGMSADNNDSGTTGNDCFIGLKFSCDICGQTFTMKHNLKRHQKMHDPGRAQQTCDLCGATFSRADNYVSHMKKKHPD